MNKKGVYFLAFGALVFLGLFAVQGCDLGDLVQVKVPDGVRNAVGLADDDRVSLNAAELTFDQWSQWVEKENAAFIDQIGQAQERAAVLGSFLQLGLEQVSAASSTFPGGAVLVSALAGVGGLFLRQPGSRRREEKTREKAFKQGAEVGALLQHEKERDNG